MEPSTIGYVGIVVFLAILFSGIPIGFGMLLVGAAGTLFIVGWDQGMSLLQMTPYRTIASYTLSVLPMFLLMGSICFYSRISEDLFYGAYKWVGHLPGGLAIATIGGCAGFSAVSGSSLATAATMGMVSLPEMKKYNYDDSLATGTLAAGGTMGVLIPPSVGFIIYGLLAQQSIGRLFAAGILPGITQALFYGILIYILCKINPSLGPRGPKTSFVEKIKTFKRVWIVAFLFVLVIGGIYFGVFSPTEAAGIGAFCSLLFAVATKRLTRANFFKSLIESAKTTAIIFVIVIGAMIFVKFLTLTKFAWVISNLILSLEVNRYLVLVCILFIYVILGCFMEGLSMALLTVPIFLPVILSLGFDPILFGVLQVRLTEIGMITPPVGMNVFVIKGIAKDVPMSTIFRGIMPFLMADVFHVALLIAVPELSLLLPNLMYNK